MGIGHVSNSESEMAGITETEPAEDKKPTAIIHIYPQSRSHADRMIISYQFIPSTLV